jgi:hypothetical protein
MADSIEYIGSGIAARMLERSVGSLKRLEESGKLNPIRSVERRRFYRADEVRALAQQLNNQKSNAQ